jgi:hypothetical protein
VPEDMSHVVTQYQEVDGSGGKMSFDHAEASDILFSETTCRSQLDIVTAET